MSAFLIGTGISAALILSCTAIFYEIIAHTWVILPRLSGKRAQILFTIFATFLAHTILVWLFGGVMYLLDTQFAFGVLKGAEGGAFLPYVYFSGVTYSSLGYGTYTATGGLQLLAVVEAVLGLTLIGWSVTFTYLVAQKYLFHRRRPD